MLMASPMAHHTGFMYGLMMQVMLKAGAVMQDIWDPAKAADLIRQYEITFTMPSTPFLADLTRVVSETGRDAARCHAGQAVGKNPEAQAARDVARGEL